MDFDFERTQPTDDGLGGVLEVCPVWDKLAIRLGVTIDKIGASIQYNPGAAALACLQQWRDGKNDGYPATWEFLLGKVKEEKGIHVADKLRGKVRIEKNWTQGQPNSSVPGPVSRIRNDPPNSGEESVDTGLKNTSKSVAGVPKDKGKYEHEDHSDNVSSADQDALFEREEQVIVGSTCVPVHKWRACENAVVAVERSLGGILKGLFTAFFLKDSSGGVYFATCFHNFCNEGEDRSKLKEGDFVKRLKDCVCHPFHTCDDSFQIHVTLKGDDILGDGSRPPQIFRERDLVIFPTNMDALNAKIKEQLGRIFNADSNEAKCIIRMHFELYAVKLQPLPPSKHKFFGKSVFSEKLAVILGHPDGKYLTHTANLKMKTEEFVIRHSITTEGGSSGSPVFIVDMEQQEPVLYGIHCGSKSNYNCGYILDTSLFERQ